jgi:hypothetical protein
MIEVELVIVCFWILSLSFLWRTEENHGIRIRDGRDLKFKNLERVL